MQPFFLLVQFLKLDAYEVLAGRRSRGAGAGAAAVVRVSSGHHLALLLRRLLLVMVVLLLRRQVPVVHVRLLGLLLLLLGMIHRSVTQPHRRIRRLTNVSRCRQFNQFIIKQQRANLHQYQITNIQT